MRRWLTVSAVLMCMLAGWVQSAKAVTLTGTVTDPSGAGITGRLILSLSQQTDQLSTGGCGGPAVLVPTAQVIITLVNGAMQGSPSVIGNDCMSPSQTYYIVTARDSNNNPLFTQNWQVTVANCGSPCNVGNIPPIIVPQGTVVAGAGYFTTLTATSISPNTTTMYGIGCILGGANCTPTVPGANMSQVNLAASGNGGVGGNLPIGNIAPGGINGQCAMTLAGTSQWSSNCVSNVKTAFNTTNYTNATVTFTNVTGLNFAVAANTNYKVVCDLFWSTSNNTSMPALQWTGPSAPTSVSYDWFAFITSSVNGGNIVAQNFSTSLSGTGTPTPGVPFRLSTTLTLINGANAGTIQLQAAASGGTGTITIYPGACSLQQ